MYPYSYGAQAQIHQVPVQPCPAATKALQLHQSILKKLSYQATAHIEAPSNPAPAPASTADLWEQGT